MLKRGTWWSLSFLITTVATLAMVNSGCSHTGDHPDSRDPAAIKSSTKYGDRGSPAEYDSGAPKDSKWFELYGAVPNYRSIGIVALGGTPMSDEKFRWQMGPMWYRGRLTPQSVKAFVVGQEGAQDENVSNRAFTGSTGTRVQKFLKHMGIHRSYLFMNTFVYTINGQLDDDPNFKWLEQGENSPIVNYRHSLFDYMLETNNETVALFMGIGAGGKASVATWVRARGGKCRAEPDLQNCDTSGMAAWFKKNKGITIKNKILAIGVPHPGGANPNLGGDAQLQNIIAGFTNSAKRVAAEKNKNPNWLPKDSDEKLSDTQLMAQMNSPFRYGHGAIPFRDFAFNTNWRMGAAGTTSNRWGADSIQVFSDSGVYNDKTSKFRKPKDLPFEMRSDRTGPKEMASNELAYESPRTTDYDYGPCGLYNVNNDQICDLANLLVSWPNMSDVGVRAISHPSLGYTGTYRGRASNAKVFILADQTSQDDFFSTRALTGAEGQKLNKLLDLSGVEKNYFILRTFPVDTLGRPVSELISGATSSAMINHYKAIFAEVRKNSPGMNTVVAFGPAAIAAARAMKMNAIELASSNELSSWNAASDQIAKKLGTKKSATYKGELAIIPRIDMPYHTRWWMGTSGDRADRGEGAAVGDYYRFWAPDWVENLQPRPIEKAEAQKLIETKNQFKNNFF
jgi:hypothetical protein